MHGNTKLKFRKLVFTDVSGQRIGHIFKCQAAQKEPLKMRPIDCPEMSVANDQTTRRNRPEERNSYLHCDWCVKSDINEVWLRIICAVTPTGKAAVLREKPVHDSCTMWTDLKSNPDPAVTGRWQYRTWRSSSVCLILCYMCSTAQSTWSNNYE